MLEFLILLTVLLTTAKSLWIQNTYCALELIQPATDTVTERQFPLWVKLGAIYSRESFMNLYVTLFYIQLVCRAMPYNYRTFVSIYISS